MFSKLIEIPQKALFCTLKFRFHSKLVQGNVFQREILTLVNVPQDDGCKHDLKFFYWITGLYLAWSFEVLERVNPHFSAQIAHIIGIFENCLSSKMASMILSALSSNRSLMESRDSSASLSIFSSQKLIFSLMSNQQFKILFEFKTSLKLTRNLPWLICQYYEKRLSVGLL